MRRTIQRGIVALAIVATLSAVGAPPAAAMDLGLVRQLSHLWSFFLGGPSPASHHRGTTSDKPAQRKSSSDTGEGGWGIDPNGNTVNSAPPLIQSGN